MGRTRDVFRYVGHYWRAAISGLTRPREDSPDDVGREGHLDHVAGELDGGLLAEAARPLEDLDDDDFVGGVKNLTPLQLPRLGPNLHQLVETYGLGLLDEEERALDLVNSLVLLGH
jgi:hypothetical protein